MCSWIIAGNVSRSFLDFAVDNQNRHYKNERTQSCKSCTSWYKFVFWSTIVADHSIFTMLSLEIPTPEGFCGRMRF